MVTQVAEDYEGADDARDEPGASNRRVGTGDGYAGGGGVGRVVCCAATANGHGCGGGWEVARGKLRPFFCKNDSTSHPTPIFSPMLGAEDISFVKKYVRQSCRG